MGAGSSAATVTRLPFADACADVATSFDVLYALDGADARQAVAEMWRVLRPGGVAMVNVAALDVLRGSHSVLTQEKQRFSKQGLTALAGRRGIPRGAAHLHAPELVPDRVPAPAVRAADRTRGDGVGCGSARAAGADQR